MSKHTQPGNVFASPAAGIQGAAGEGLLEESAPRFPRPRGRHRPTAGFRPIRGVAVVVSATALAGAAFAVGTNHSSASSPARAQAAISVPQLTAADVQQLQYMTPAQRQHIGAELDAVFSRLGMEAGIGNPRTTVTGTQLTSYDWSGGITWNEAWATASWADLHTAMTKFHTHAALLAFITTVAAAVTGGLAAAICAVLAAGIVGLDEDGNFTPVSNHGVWYAVWWIPPHKQGGYW